MRYTWLAGLSLVSLLAAPSPALAQGDGPRRPPMDSTMRQRVERRLADRVKRELQLTDDQTSRLNSTTEQYAKRREELRTRERALREALADQLRPGVAANNDSVARLTDALVGMRMSFAESFKGELKDMSAYLTPVQRARFFTIRERLFRAAREAPGQRPGGRPKDRRGP